jgi:chemotaxis protein histidine kinase CheA
VAAQAEEPAAAQAEGPAAAQAEEPAAAQAEEPAAAQAEGPAAAQAEEPAAAQAEEPAAAQAEGPAAAQAEGPAAAQAEGPAAAQAEGPAAAQAEGPAAAQAEGPAAAQRVAARQVAARQEVAQQAAARQEVAQQAAVRRVAAQRVAARRVAAQRVAARQEVVQQEVARPAGVIEVRREARRAARRVVLRVLPIVAPQPQRPLATKLASAVEPLAPGSLRWDQSQTPPAPGLVEFNIMRASVQNFFTCSHGARRCSAGSNDGAPGSTHHMADRREPVLDREERLCGNVDVRASLELEGEPPRCPDLVRRLNGDESGDLVDHDRALIAHVSPHRPCGQVEADAPTVFEINRPVSGRWAERDVRQDRRADRLRQRLVEKIRLLRRGSPRHGRRVLACSKSIASITAWCWSAAARRTVP